MRHALAQIPTIAWLLLGPAMIAAAAFIRAAIKQLGLDVTKAVLWIFTRRARQAISAAVNLRRYSKLALAAPGTSALIIPSATGTTTVRTDDVFVRLRFETRSNSSDRFTSENVLRAGNRIRIVGEPGSGKTSLIKRVFRDLCRAGLLSPISARIPILVELRDLSVPAGLKYDKQRIDWIIKRVHDRVAAVEGHNMAEFFDLAVRQNGVVIFLDGLDEVATEAYSRTANIINLLSKRLSELSSNNGLLITMRTQFYQQVHRDLDDEFPATLHLKRFSPADIFEFLTRWFQGSPDSMNRASAIFQELADRPSLRELCTTPLILAMYTASFRATGDVDLPDTRTEFYRLIVDELIIKRRSRQLNERKGRIAKKNDRYLIFGQIAYDNLVDRSRPANSAPWNHAVEIVQKVMGSNDYSQAEELLGELGKETGIFSEERRGETIRFIHLTLCEYLAAVDAATNRKDGWRDLIENQKILADSNVGRSRLMETIPFAVALLPRGQHADCLGEVYDLGDSELYVRCILETQAYGHGKWSQYLSLERDQLVHTPHDQWDEQWLTRLNLYRTAVTEHAAVEGGSSPVTRRSLIDTLFTDLVAEQKERLVYLFGAYAIDNPSAAFDLSRACGLDLVKETPQLVVEGCANPPFLSVCIKLAAESNTPEQWARILAGAGMRYRLTARELANEPLPDSWRVVTDGLDGRFAWEMSSGASARITSYYGAAISLAMQAAVQKSSDAKGDGMRLGILKTVRAPGRLVPKSVLVAAGALMTLLPAARFALPGRPAQLLNSAAGNALLYAAVSEITIYSGVLLLVYAGIRSRAYRSLTNLEDPFFVFSTSRSRISDRVAPAFWPSFMRVIVRYALLLYARRLFRALAARASESLAA